MENYNPEKQKEHNESDQKSVISAIEPKQKNSKMLLPMIAILLVFMLVRAFNVSSPENAVSEPISLIEQKVVDADNTETYEQLNWQIPEMYPNKLTDAK